MDQLSSRRYVNPLDVHYETMKHSAQWVFPTHPVSSVPVVCVSPRSHQTKRPATPPRPAPSERRRLDEVSAVAAPATPGPRPGSPSAGLRRRPRRAGRGAREPGDLEGRGEKEGTEKLRQYGRGEAGEALRACVRSERTCVCRGSSDRPEVIAALFVSPQVIGKASMTRSTKDPLGHKLQAKGIQKSL